ncbi:MAG: outer membrane lipoprotein chaperone LolA [Aliidiomarina sp.]|uniref:outer membrane lipoprotein chaperone LolA n=1 Tax=Aliidiomarina sp. TaxID=1872439 RepID=UPI0025C1BC8A|nr:outer membrane lipoprotein chaperone LolA [Aliidiomarina sp.]MCH8501830.1 outer membrane lipoprotein chaperone LolA [Aliidiomarina sp.]
MYRTLFTHATLLAALFVGHSAVAETKADSNVNSETSLQAASAQALQQRLYDLKSLQGHFMQEIFEDGHLIQELQGHFVLERPARLRWVTEAPEASVMVADGDTLWYYNPFIEQVTLFNQADAMQSNPLLLLLENEQQDWQDFIVEQQDHDQLQVWSIADKPGTSGSGSVLELAFRKDSSAKFALETIRLRDLHGQESVFYLANLVYNAEVDGKPFQFDIPAGTDIDDQRDD